MEETLVENSYLDLQKCGISRNDVKVTMEFGIWKTGDTCPDEILWYQDGLDFTVSAREGELKVNREELENSNAYSQTSSGKIEHTRKMTLKPSYNSRLYQKFMDIQIRDSQEGYEGKLIQAYSDGGFHMRMKIEAVDGTYSFTELSLNIKLETFIDTFFADLSDPEAEAELEMAIEWSPIYLLEGTLPEAFAIPSKYVSPSIEFGQINNTISDLKVLGIELNDPDLLAFNTKVRVEAYGENTLIGTDIVESGEFATILGDFETDKIYQIKFGYFISEEFYYITNDTEYKAT